MAHTKFEDVELASFFDSLPSPHQMTKEDLFNIPEPPNTLFSPSPSSEPEQQQQTPSPSPTKKHKPSPSPITTTFKSKSPTKTKNTRKRGRPKKPTSPPQPRKRQRIPKTTPKTQAKVRRETVRAQRLAMMTNNATATATTKTAPPRISPPIVRKLPTEKIRAFLDDNVILLQRMDMNLEEGRLNDNVDLMIRFGGNIRALLAVLNADGAHLFPPLPVKVNTSFCGKMNGKE